MQSAGMFKVLVVDDEEDIVEILKYNLIKEGYDVRTANNGIEALHVVREFPPDLILLDIMMPEMDGIETCVKLREMPEVDHTLIAFLTARGENYTQISALENGGDDFITKPIKPNVLMARVKALLRRLKKEKPAANETIILGNLKIFPQEFKISVNGKERVLPKKEFELLSLLTSNPGKVFKRKEIMNKVWGGDIIVGDRTIDVHIRKLREKIGSDYIFTLKGVGYRFVIIEKLEE